MRAASYSTCTSREKNFIESFTYVVRGSFATGEQLLHIFARDSLYCSSAGSM
jgi:hypothetical protein